MELSYLQVEIAMNTVQPEGGPDRVLEQRGKVRAFNFHSGTVREDEECLEKRSYVKEDQSEFLKDRGRVRASSNNCDEEQYIWESALGVSFTVQMTPRWFSVRVLEETSCSGP